VPCVTLRDQTEWPETVECGANRVAGTNPDSIREAVRDNSMPGWSTAPLYGDGKSALKIIDQLLATGNN